MSKGELYAILDEFHCSEVELVKEIIRLRKLVARLSKKSPQNKNDKK